MVSNDITSFINTDLALEGVMRQCEGIDRVLIAYDVACQFCVNLKERMEQEFPDLSLDAIEFAIGKMHVQGHVEKCHWVYNLHWLNNVGRMDGEAAERLWSELNRAAGSTKHMTPGHREDKLDDILQFWNEYKLYKLGGQEFLPRMRAKLLSYPQPVKLQKNFPKFGRSSRKQLPFSRSKTRPQKSGLRRRLSKNGRKLPPSLYTTRSQNNGKALSDQQLFVRIERCVLYCANPRVVTSKEENARVLSANLRGKGKKGMKGKSAVLIEMAMGIQHSQ